MEDEAELTTFSSSNLKLIFKSFYDLFFMHNYLRKQYKKKRCNEMKS
jgi:hypothetical protein